jgi:hypothetical protein
MRACSSWLWVPVLWFVAGCSGQNSEQAKVYPVNGSVYFNGKPAAGATVRVHGVEGTGGPLMPRAVVQKDGTFALTTYEAGDGVAPGRYRASVYWRQQGREEGQEGPSLIPERYSRPETSGLEIEVKAEPENKLAPFILKP